MGVLQRGLADVPLRRLAGVITISDGQVHDLPAIAANDQGAKGALGFDAPIHLLMTGDPKQGDRRIDADRSAELRPGRQAGRGEVPGRRSRQRQCRCSAHGHIQPRRPGLALGPGAGRPDAEALQFPTSTMAARPVFEIEAETGRRNSPASTTAPFSRSTACATELKVLLISGEPYPGERIWRNLLKSDPSVGLIHFTILRPPNKQDATPINELALIAFPIDELFDIKLKEFDLIIFDRFQHLRHPAGRIFPAHRRLCERMAARCWKRPGPARPASSASTARRCGDLRGPPTGEILNQGFKPERDRYGQAPSGDRRSPGDPDADRRVGAAGSARWWPPPRAARC